MARVFGESGRLSRVRTAANPDRRFGANRVQQRAQRIAEHVGRESPYFDALQATYSALSPEVRALRGFGVDTPARPSLLALTATRLLARAGCIEVATFERLLTDVQPAIHTSYDSLDQSAIDVLVVACLTYRLPLATAYADSYARKIRATDGLSSPPAQLQHTLFLRTPPAYLKTYGSKSVTLPDVTADVGIRLYVGTPPVPAQRLTAERVTYFPGSGRLFTEGDAGSELGQDYFP